MSNYTITSTSKATSGMTLSNGLLTGDTYNAREYIKKSFGGKWNKDAKGWTVNTQQVIDAIDDKVDGFCSMLKVVDFIPAKIEAKKSEYVSGYCNKCGTYCYGDCQS